MRERCGRGDVTPMTYLNGNTVTLDDASDSCACDSSAMDGRRPRVVLSITPRLLQDTLTVALSQHADVVDLAQWRDQRNAAGEDLPAFDVAVVSGGPLPEAVAADIIIDIDGHEGVPSLDSINAQLQALSADGG